MDLLLEQKFPELVAHMKHCGYETSMSTLQWFTCLFAYTFQFEALQRLWDLIFIKGTAVIFQIALAIFDQLQPALLKCRSLVEIVHVMQQTPATLSDCDKFITIVDRYEISPAFVA